MLNERDYMKMGKAPFRSGPKAKGEGISAVKILIVANIVVFIMQWLNPGTETMMSLTDRFALVAPAVREGQVYRLITSMFLHGGVFHIMFNMWGLFLFGSLLEQRIGRKHFLIMYFLSGLTGSALWMATNWSSPVGCIGASGALFGVIISTAMFFPDVKIMLLFPPIPMKLKTFAFVYIIIEIMMETSNMGKGGFFGNVAHIVHLGGALGGYIYIRLLFSKEISWDIFPRSKHKKSSYRVPSGWDTVGNSSDSGSQVTQSELDHMLDKISNSGINSLSEEEMEKLRSAREQMQQNRGR